MSATPPPSGDPVAKRAPIDALARFSRAVLLAVGADEATADAATRAMLHGSRLGVDSHGVRLLEHYAKVLTLGRVNPRPEMRISSNLPAIATLDADNGHGALATYKAMEHAVQIAQTNGLGAVAVQNSSHFGPAGAFALAAAEAGCIGLVSCNSDSIVRLHDGAAPFHGTNPIAVAAPSGEARPWLFDMATSAISYNKVRLSRSLGRTLPAGVASSADGEDTQDAAEATMLAPLGGAFGFKGAGMAGIAEILSAVFTGMRLSFEVGPMVTPNMSKPRHLGAFVLAMRADAVVGEDGFQSSMQRYLKRLRASPARAGAAVMAPGDREWAEAARRETQGVPVDPETAQAFERFAGRFGIALPFMQNGAG
ncbi:MULTISPECIES: Ldh family oxidoreductase [Rhodomicrobium]|uniref:Ldh family oxidoreductase n=1 Tax=Rhodomicrobium TaxID=1068 RepID=UPI000B4A7B0E|nr:MULTISPECIES: Ldh family oxidoreductase [Rhodomicrobium]